MSGRIPDWQLEDMGFDIEEANRRYERAETIQVNFRGCFRVWGLGYFTKEVNARAVTILVNSLPSQPSGDFATSIWL